MSSKATKETADTANLLWGARAIADYAGLPVSQLYHLLKIGALDGVVTKLSHKVIVARKSDVALLPQRGRLRYRTLPCEPAPPLNRGLPIPPASAGVSPSTCAARKPRSVKRSATS